MEKLSFQDKVCILSCLALALMLMCSAAEQTYFHQDGKVSWDEARNHCQVCFKDLVTLTPHNIQTIAKNLTSDYWIGLRKTFNNFTGNYTSNYTSNSSFHWTHWANGDPLTFQNWYPGWPKSARNIKYCGCSCTYSEPTTSHMTSTPTSMTTQMPPSETTTSDYTSDSSSMNTETPYSDMTASDYTSDSSSMNTETPYSDMTASDYTSDSSSMNTETPYSDMTASDYTSDSSSMNTETPYSDMTASDYTSDSSSMNTETPYTETMTSHMTSAPHPMTTQTPEEATCSPRMVPLDYHDADEDTTSEDFCVVMLSFGAWVVKNCSEPLSYICYEDPFIADINVTETTFSSVSFTWSEMSGKIDHYRVEVHSDNMTLKANTDDMMHVFNDLTEGTRYTIEVFPVKCGRDLNPQGVHFYTLPNKVISIEVSNVTETSVFLNWSKPVGNTDFYRVEYLDKHLNISTADKEITGLTPGNRYTFKVQSGVDKDGDYILSEETSKTTYTKPEKVTNLRVSESTKTSMLLEWDPPEGNYTGFRVIAVYDTDKKKSEVISADKTQWKVKDLPICRKIKLSVAALTNHDTLEGDKVEVVNYTEPEQISDLKLEAGYDYINASWDYPGVACSSFHVKLQLHDKDEKMHNVTGYSYKFDSLKSAANYTVIVYSISGNIKSPPVKASNFTLPVEPTDPDVKKINKTHVAFSWKTPKNALAANYQVRAKSSFWGQEFTHIVESKTNFTFGPLYSGTKYEFEVRTKAERLSNPANMTYYTDPDLREITLSMLCSSKEPLHCDKSSTRLYVFEKLKEHFHKELGDNIKWNLAQMTSNSETKAT